MAISLKSRFCFFLLLLIAGAAYASPAYKFRFQANLEALLMAANTTMGFHSLEGTEVATGQWLSIQELDGFHTTIREKENDPRGILYVSAVSVRPDAARQARMLALKGLRGYTLRDSDKDPSVPIDKTIQARKVMLTKRQKYVTVTVSIIFIAHEDNSVLLTVEAR